MSPVVIHQTKEGRVHTMQPLAENQLPENIYSYLKRPYWPYFFWLRVDKHALPWK